MSDAACCDECGTFAVLAESVKPRRFPEEVLPTNWLRVFCLDNDSQQKDGPVVSNYKVDGQFCSFACASKFLAKVGAARG